jgi:DNA-binding NtrC family response regulator
VSLDSAASQTVAPESLWREELPGPTERPPPVKLSALVGSSAPMARLRAAIAKVAASDRPVLVQGPTGSGKELVALAIHALGADPDTPLVDVNCAAVSEDGLVAAAAEGTLFLDEIGDLVLPLQARLLRVLDERRLAGRIVSATNVDLRERVRTGSFRDDLYHRLSVLVLRVPPLEERREDIRELVLHFAGLQERRIAFTDDAIDLLAAAPWPGNVRQLRNAIDQLAVFADDCAIRGETIAEILAEVVAPAAAEVAVSLRSLARAVLSTRAPNKLQAMEAALVEEALARTSGNRSRAARLLGVERKVVERRLATRARRGDPDAVDTPSQGR